MDKVKEELKELGYSQESIERLIKSSSLSQLKPDTLLNNITRNYEFLLKCGDKKNEILNMTKKVPTIYIYSTENIEKKMIFMERLGYSRNDILKMTKKVPTIYNYSIENMQTKIEDMENLGYTKKEVIKMTKKLPTIYSINMSNINKKIEDMEGLGYRKDEILDMTKRFPEIYSYKIKSMKEKIEFMESLGYNQSQVLKMAKDLPTIYGLSKDNIKQKIEFYDSLGLHEIFVDNPQYLMQSVALSYARYMFFKEKDIEIDTSNCRRLFVGEKVFKYNYGGEKEKLLKKYNYSEYIEKKAKHENVTSLTRAIKDVSLKDAQKGEEVLNKLEKGELMEEKDGITIDEKWWKKQL